MRHYLKHLSLALLLTTAFVSGNRAHAAAVSLDLRVVGGGAAAGDMGGGGGAGRDMKCDGFITTDTSIAVTVGIGGTPAGVHNVSQGTDGGQSTFADSVSPVVAPGGGYGGTQGQTGGGHGGGSGGGGGLTNNVAGAASAGSGCGTGLGNAGGTGSASLSAAGGGGSGAVGADAALNNGGNGGTGTGWYDGVSRAAGGGGGGRGDGAGNGGTGGTGGGGNADAGATHGTSTVGAGNTGSGGGGSGYDGVYGTPRAGGSGVVQIRYLTASMKTLGTGGTITTVGAYTYHTFNSSGTFTVPVPISGTNPLSPYMKNSNRLNVTPPRFIWFLFFGPKAEAMPADHQAEQVFNVSYFFTAETKNKDIKDKIAALTAQPTITPTPKATAVVVGTLTATATVTPTATPTTDISKLTPTVTPKGG